MIGWLSLTKEQRKATIDQAEQMSGIRAKAIEKDWWVTLTLKALFQTAYAGHMVFKGGTSLSKGWKLIARFSEDVDIALAPEAFGMAYQENPSKGYVTKLKREGCQFTSTVVKEALEQQFTALGVPGETILVKAAPITCRT
jgi:predicted nucleotidyltransferase component of viral defense system